jgi:hypothetical protein
VAQYEAEQARSVEDLQAWQRAKAIEGALQGSEAARILSQIASDYRRRTYLKDDMFI